jgi:branched-subunit amino acid aminotransferase/4-amino-4-deoxychorismate lyase
MPGKGRPAATPPAFSERQFRDALAQFATGVTIVCARAPDQRYVGFTANSFSSVSLDPPLILWTLSRRSSSLDAFEGAGRYAGNVLMRQLAMDHGAVETVMFRNGYLTEASASNVMIVRDGRIAAPPKDNLILPGITYDATHELAREIGVPLEIRAVSHAETMGADEIWLSSSTKEVLAVTSVDGAPFGGGAPGPVFRRVWEAFQGRKYG